jgi:hypothetical protein
MIPHHNLSFLQFCRTSEFHYPPTPMAKFANAILLPNDSLVKIGPRSTVKTRERKIILFTPASGTTWA